MNSVTVFCGSKPGKDELYLQHARQLGKLLAEHKVKLIYGAGNAGMMGALANACLENGGEAVGIIPKFLVEWEQQHVGLTEVFVTNDMHERKKLLYQKAETAIILAGGYGTLDEFFEIITWNNLKTHSKKIYIVNTNGFYNHLLAHLNMMQQEGFLYEDWKEKIIVCNEPSELVKHF